MVKAMINSRIEEFASRLDGQCFVERMGDFGRPRLIDLNMRLYAGEFNAENYSSAEKIGRMWDWLCGDNPASECAGDYGWVAGIGNDLIGQWRMLPSIIKVGRHTYKCAWGADLAVLKEYRNLGIGALLVSRVKKAVSRDLPALLLGGMNGNSYGIFRESGFTDLGMIPRYLKVIDPRAILESYGAPAYISRLFRSPLKSRDVSPSPADAEMDDDIGAEFDEFWDSVSAHYMCLGKRDAAYIRWKYKKSPLWPYNIISVRRSGSLAAFAVVRDGIVKSGALKGGPIGVITDMLADPGDGRSVRSLLAAVTRHFAVKGALLVKCDMLNAGLERLLRRSGFIGIRPAHRFMLGANGLASGDEALASDRNNWLITSGDSDLDFY